MRLKSIKLAGFKSFAEAVVFPTSANLTGIVGPNGCGKSNVVDAIRWVMGERSAGALRGEDMHDVIFNGSSNRPAIDRASVDLVFSPVQLPDSSPWSKYSELSIRRIMFRNKTSDYLINGQKVRRKDIADLFMGTGLGPRSYAIIEQGMVNRIVESNPKDLRIYLEEAAGVSKYKERRLETENRMEDTRANLIRVEDIRATVAEQVEKLREQAKVALQYQNYQENFLANQRMIAIIQLQMLISENDNHRSALQKEVTLMSELQTEKTKWENEVISAEENWQKQQNILEEVQSNISALVAQIAEIEQNLRLGEQSRQNLTNNRQKLVERLSHDGEQKSQLEFSAEELDEQQVTVSEQKKVTNEEFLITQQSFYKVEKELNEARRKYDELRRQEAIIASARGAKIQEKISIEHRLSEISEQLLENQNELATLPQSNNDSVKTPIMEFPQQQKLNTCQEELEICLEQQQNLNDEIAEVEEKLLELTTEINSHKQIESELNGQIRTLQRQVQALAINSGEEFNRWFAEREMLISLALAENIRAEGKWRHAVYTVLDSFLGAKYLAQININKLNQSEQPPTGVLVINQEDQKNVSKKTGTLSEHFQVSDPAFSSFLLNKLNNYRLCDSWCEAINNRHQLAENEFFVSVEGIQIGKDVIVFAGSGGEQTIHLENLQSLETAKNKLTVNSGNLQSILTAQEELTRKRQRQSSNSLTLNQKIKVLQEELIQLEKDSQQWFFEQKSSTDKFEWQQRQIGEQISNLQQQQIIWTEKLNNLQNNLVVENNNDNSFQENINLAQIKVQDLATSLRSIREEQHQKEIKVREFEQVLIQIARDITRVREQILNLESSLEKNNEQLENIDEELQNIPDGESTDEELQTLLQEKVQLESQKKEILTTTGNFGESVRETRANIQKCELQIQKSRDKIENLRLKNQETELSAKSFREDYVRYGGDINNIEGENINAVVANIEVGINKNSLQKLQSQTQTLEENMKQLEPVNLAAIAELETESTKLQHLETQQKDLIEALSTLTNAIASIDSETRSRMQDVFSAVNVKFNENFVRIFGGGTAEIILTGEEVLDAGVILKAQPLGKKNSSIHLLSGGEKALTAIALIFAFFALNPAPFCVLDEIDASLDDNNTRLFTELIKSMSLQTQFLIITHNRITMEVMETLNGVTMSEPGVSKMVAVDLLNSVMPLA